MQLDDVIEFITLIPQLLIIGIGFYIAIILAVTLSSNFGIITGVVYLLKVLYGFVNDDFNATLNNLAQWAGIAAVKSTLFGVAIAFFITNLQNPLTLVIGLIIIGAAYLEISNYKK
jgi:hypothetical protein